MSILQINTKTDWQQNDSLNAGELNRIEGNIAVMYAALIELPYGIPSQTHKRNWTRDGVPTTADIKRLCDNIMSIAEHYYIPPHYEQLKKIADKMFFNDTRSRLDNNDVNYIEECLWWLCEVIKNGWNYNTHRSLWDKRFTHSELRKFRHWQIRKSYLSKDEFIELPPVVLKPLNPPPPPVELPTTQTPPVEPPTNSTGITTTPANLVVELRRPVDPWPEGNTFVAQYNLYITNMGNNTIMDWTVEIPLPAGVTFDFGNNGATASGSKVIVKPVLEWNKQFPPNQTVMADAFFNLRSEVRNDLIF